jgi:hypothetical protein
MTKSKIIIGTLILVIIAFIVVVKLNHKTNTQTTTDTIVPERNDTSANMSTTSTNNASDSSQN